MASEWVTYNLGQILDIKNGKSRPKIEGKYPVYGGNGVLGFADQYNIEGETIIIGRVGAYCGAVYYENNRSWISDNALYAKTKNNDTKFLYYLLKNKNLNQFAGGSSHPLLTQSGLNELIIEIPGLPTQREIASILSALDDKIELNRQTNETLEEMAKAIFKEWFVNFNYPGATGKTQQSELGEIPEGWSVGKLGEVLEVKGGTTPSTKNPDFWNGYIQWATPKDLSDLKAPVLLSTERTITPLGLNHISSGLLPAGTLLMSSRAPIGYLAISEIPVAINQGFIAINSRQLSNLYFLFWLKANMMKIISVANGSTFLEISKSVFKELDVVIPDINVHNAFLDLVAPLYKRIVEGEQETRSLISIRDSILPKLMTGEIEVN